ncbi:hypothetical protein DFH07DRAFT_948143 [Mycena maculata]|uniref:Uncharacterized protein n=1 Tax=Mycena maculata TaxID=230809 RepID=A0AAD7KGD2_9AGAR|nr:hypothetical protein DFH07DRAFT_948143 [Mycena maculata]
MHLLLSSSCAGSAIALRSQATTRSTATTSWNVSLVNPLQPTGPWVIVDESSGATLTAWDHSPDSVLPDAPITLEELNVANDTRQQFCRTHTDNEEVQDANQNLAKAQAQLKPAQAKKKSNSSGHVRVSRPQKRRRSFDSEQPEESTDPSETAGFVEDDTSARPPWERLKLSSLKGWGIQRNGVAMSAADYAKNHWDEFK